MCKVCEVERNLSWPGAAKVLRKYFHLLKRYCVRIIFNYTAIIHLPVGVNSLDSQAVGLPVLWIFIFTIQPPTKNTTLNPVWGKPPYMIRKFVVISLNGFTAG